MSSAPRGIAAIYQNEWVEAVLCEVKEFPKQEKPYSYEKPIVDEIKPYTDYKLEIAQLLCNGVSITDKGKLKELDEKLKLLNLNSSTRVHILRSIRSPLESPRYTKLAPIVMELFPSIKEAFIESFERTSDTEQWSIDVDNAIRTKLNQKIEEDLVRSIRQCIITDYLYNDLGKTDLLEDWANNGGVK